MTVCPAVSSQKAKPSAHPRTEQANKVRTSCLTPALTGLWVGCCSDVSRSLQAAQWKGHIWWRKHKKKQCAKCQSTKLHKQVTCAKEKLSYPRFKKGNKIKGNFILITTLLENFKGQLLVMAGYFSTDNYVLKCFINTLETKWNASCCR